MLDKPITKEFIQTFMTSLPINSASHIKNIIIPNGVNWTQQNLQTILNEKQILLIWRQSGPIYNNMIFSNQNLFGISKKDVKINFEFQNKKKPVSVFALDSRELENKTFGLFKDYITKKRTKYPLPIEKPNLYLNLVPTTKVLQENLYGGQKGNITYEGFILDKTNLSNILNRILIDYEEKGMDSNDAMPYSGKIDLDRASTEEKLSEIIRLLQNIGYNLFTLTPNYEESERNKKLKSKGVDLRELFKQKNNYNL